MCCSSNHLGTEKLLEPMTGGALLVAEATLVEGGAEEGVPEQFWTRLSADLDAHWKFEKENESVFNHLRELARREKQTRGGKVNFAPLISRRWARSNLDLLGEAVNRLKIPLIRGLDEDKPDAVTWCVGQVVARHRLQFSRLAELQKLYVAATDAIRDLHKVQEAIDGLDQGTIEELQSWEGQALRRRFEAVPYCNDAIYLSDTVRLLCKTTDKNEIDKVFDARELWEETRHLGANLGLCQFVVLSYLPQEMVPEANRREGARGRPPSPFTTPTLNLIMVWEFLTGCRASSPAGIAPGKESIASNTKSEIDQSPQDSTQFIFTVLRLIDQRVDVQNTNTAILRCLQEIGRRNGKR